MSKELYELLKRRDTEIAALRAYVEALEEELRRARGESAHEYARDDAQKAIDELRYEHGFRAGSDMRLR